MRASPRRAEDAIGERFGRLVVLSVRKDDHGRSVARCLCDCGVEHECILAGLRQRGVGSCGCLLRDRIRKHGLSGTPEYLIWKGLRGRCLNPRSRAWHRYGGRGITVCPEWLASFEAFFAHIGPRPGPGFSIDRINNDAGYFPGNVRWTTAKVQASNRCNNTYVVVDGERRLASEIGVQHGVNPTTLHHRLMVGWDPATAATTPPRDQRPRITINGVERLAHDVCREHGVDKNVYRARVYNGWDPVRAATTPARPYVRRAA